MCSWHALLLVLLIPLAGCANVGAAHEPDRGQAAAALERGWEANQTYDWRTGEEAYREALHYDPSFAAAYHYLGRLAASHGDLGAAEANYRRALALDPSYPPALYELALLHEAAGEREMADARYQAVSRVVPTDAGTHLLVGLAYGALGQEQQGAAHLTMAVLLDPSLEPQLAALRDPAASSAAVAGVKATHALSPR